MHETNESDNLNLLPQELETFETLPYSISREERRALYLQSSEASEFASRVLTFQLELSDADEGQWREVAPPAPRPWRANGITYDSVVTYAEGAVGVLRTDERIATAFAFDCIPFAISGHGSGGETIVGVGHQTIKQGDANQNVALMAQWLAERCRDTQVVFEFDDRELNEAQAISQVFAQRGIKAIGIRRPNHGERSESRVIVSNDGMCIRCAWGDDTEHERTTLLSWTEVDQALAEAPNGQMLADVAMSDGGQPTFQPIF